MPRSGGRISTNSITFNFGISLVALSPDAGTIVCFAAVGFGPLYAIDVAANTNWIISAGNRVSNAGLRFSDDGRFLAYAAATNSSGVPQRLVYLYDFQTRSNQLISRRYNLGGACNDYADSPVISADGRFVAYRSFASNSVPDDFNNVPDLFLYDRVQNSTRLLTANLAGGTVANSRSLKPVFSSDSSRLVLQSWADDLLGQDFNQASDVFGLSLVPPPIVDADADGMDDQWELDHFSTLARDGTGDYDNDGDTDGREFWAGTDPTDPTSLFRSWLDFTGPPGALISVTWPIAPGRTYRVQFKNSLGDPAWQDLNGSMIVIGDTDHVIDLAPAGGPEVLSAPAGYRRGCRRHG